MLNVTYYLGAGASFASLPLYGCFQQRLSVFRDYVFHFEKKYKGEVTKDQFQLYIQKLDELINLLDPYDCTSIDVLAHELSVRPNSNSALKFFQLKYLINDFFVFEQLKKPKYQYLTQFFDASENDHYTPYEEELCTLVNNALDKRYKSFILPLLGTARKFPPNINFISWNYDLQMELAFAQIQGISINLAQQDLQVFPSPSIDKIDMNASALIKVNGTAGIYYENYDRAKLANTIDEKAFDWYDTYLEFMIQIFYNNSERIFGGKPIFKFYFEEPNLLHNNSIENAKAIMAKTDVLIVIGYSFHSANREIDQEILKNCKQLKKVIIQTEEADYNNVKNNFINTLPDFKGRIELYSDLRNFPQPNNIGDLTPPVGFATGNITN